MSDAATPSRVVEEGSDIVLTNVLIRRVFHSPDRHTLTLLLTLGLGAILTALVVFLLGVPMLGDWGNYALVVFVLLCASLSLGFFVSLSAKTDSQAIQSAMVILLASIFFSGFFLALYRLWEPVQVVSWALPVTYGINLLQSVMLRGQSPNVLLLGALILYALVLFLISWWRLGRVMARQ